MIRPLAAGLPYLAVFFAINLCGKAGLTHLSLYCHSKK
jgi:hypothetical protein